MENAAQPSALLHDSVFGSIPKVKLEYRDSNQADHDHDGLCRLSTSTTAGEKDPHRVPG